MVAGIMCPECDRATPAGMDECQYCGADTSMFDRKGNRIRD